MSLDLIKEYASSQEVELLERIRVEQGEYAVASQATKIGTHNIRQCLVIYAQNKT